MPKHLFDNTQTCTFHAQNPPACTRPVVWRCKTLSIRLCQHHLDSIGAPCSACPHFDLCEQANPRLTLLRKQSVSKTRTNIANALAHPTQPLTWTKKHKRHQPGTLSHYANLTAGGPPMPSIRFSIKQSPSPLVNSVPVTRVGPSARLSLAPGALALKTGELRRAPIRGSLFSSFPSVIFPGCRQKKSKTEARQNSKTTPLCRLAPSYGKRWQGSRQSCWRRRRLSLALHAFS